LVLPWRKVFVLFHQVSFCIVPLKKTNLFVFKWFKTCSDNVKFHFLCYSFGTTYWIRNLMAYKMPMTNLNERDINQTFQNFFSIKICFCSELTCLLPLTTNI
jgi:hypothetical protein